MATERSFSTDVGDLVLSHFEEKPAGFARIEAIRPHDTPGWYFCDLMVLALPLQPLTWILEQVQIEGASFTMGGRGVRLVRLADPGASGTAPEPATAPPATPSASATAEDPLTAASSPPDSAPLAPESSPRDPASPRVVSLDARRTRRPPPRS